MRKLSSSQARNLNKIRWGKSIPLEDYPWKEMEYDNHHNKMSTNELMEKYNLKRGKMDRAKRMGLLNYIPPKKRPPTSEKTKEKMSRKRKQFLKENPESHPWRSKDKFQSKPCNHLKKKLRLKGIDFVEEYIPLEDRAFSIDIAFPDKMIGIEINGNQHYERTGELKPYYQERHDLIQAAGWKLYEIHYSLAWDEELFEEILNKIKDHKYKIEFDYMGFVKNKLEKKVNRCVDCDAEILKSSTRCKPCSEKVKKRVKKKKPSKEKLIELYNTTPMTKIAKIYKVSDTLVKKWLKIYEIPTENRLGYWAKNGKR